MGIPENVSADGRIFNIFFCDVFKRIGKIVHGFAVEIEKHAVIEEEGAIFDPAGFRPCDDLLHRDVFRGELHGFDGHECETNRTDR